MRIAIGGLSHETNCFAKHPTELETFERNHHTGDEILKTNQGTRTYCGGLLDEIRQRGGQAVCTYVATATPSGIITKEAAETMVGRIVDGMWAAHCEEPLDGIALSLHGAAVAREHPDLEGYLLRCIRECFGNEIPVGIVLDLHGNITAEMVELSDIAVGVKCYPHVDQYEASRSMLGLLWEMAATGVKPCKKLIKLPWFIAPGAGVTLSGPAAKVRQLCIDLEQNGAVLQAGFFHGFPYADISAAGVSVVTAAGTQQAADSAAQKIAEFAWGIRQEFVPPILDAESAVTQAMHQPGLVVINESSDNTGGGAPGDGTFLLQALLKNNEPGTVFVGFYDPEVVELALQTGVGGTVSCLLGGKTDTLHGAPVKIEEALIEAECDGRFVCKSAMGAGAVKNMGNSVLLKVGNIRIIVVSRRAQPMDDGLMELLGLDYRKQRLIALKSSQHFKAWWVPRCDCVVTADPPGIHCSDLRCFEFKQAYATNYPLQDARWTS